MPTLDLRQPAADTAMAERDPAPPPRPAAAPPSLTWEAPEYQAQEKTTLWYVAFGVVLALLLFAAFLLRSFLTGIVFGLLGVLVLLYSERQPRTARFEITGSALRINDRLYPFRELDAFNVVDSPGGPLLLVRSRRLVMPLLHVPLGEVDPEVIREALRPLLTEDPDLRESLADLLAHRLGF